MPTRVIMLHHPPAHRSYLARWELMLPLKVQQCAHLPTRVISSQKKARQAKKHAKQAPTNQIPGPRNVLKMIQDTILIGRQKPSRLRVHQELIRTLPLPLLA